MCSNCLCYNFCMNNNNQENINPVEQYQPTPQVAQSAPVVPSENPVVEAPAGGR